MPEQNKPPGRIITFYSYKGGTGRSMALANVAWILASSGKRVLVIDWDLEAPGLQRYFRPFLVDKELTASKGIIDYVTDFAAAAVKPISEGEKVPVKWYVKQADLTDYIVSLDAKSEDGKFPGGGLLDFIPAGQQGPTYAARFTSFNWYKFYDRLGGGEFLEAAKKQMRADYDYVLIDSRTGVSDTAGICTVQMPDMLVVCFTYNNQSIEGAAAVARSVVERRAELKQARASGGDGDSERDHEDEDEDGDEDEYRFRVLPIPMRADYSMPKLDLRRRVARKKFNSFIEGGEVGDPDAYWGAVEVPYQAPYAYEELLSTFYDDPADVKSVLAAMMRITGHLTGQTVNEFRLSASPEERKKVLDEFAGPIEADVAQAATPATAVAQETEIARLRRLAEDAYAGLSEDEKKAAPRLWTRLVHVPRRRESLPLSRVKVDKEDFPPTARPLVRKFGPLLISDRDADTNAKTVEAASEEFVRVWPRLQEWIAADRDFIVWRQQFQETVIEWRRLRDATSGGGEKAATSLPVAATLIDGYLLKGRALQEAEEFARTRPEDLNARELEFIKRCRTRVRMVFLRTAGGLAAALLLTFALIYGVGKVYNRWNNAAERQRKAALSSNLVREAESLGTGSAESAQLGTLLALEAKRLADEAEDAQQLEKSAGVLKANLPLLPRLYAPVSFGSDVARAAVSQDGNVMRLTTVSGLSGPTGGSVVGSVGGYRKLTVRGLPDGKAVTDFQFNDDVNNFALSPDGRHLAYVTAALPPATLRGGASFMTTSFTQAGERQPSGSTTYTVRVLATGNVSKPVWEKSTSTGGQMVFSPDGRFFASASSGDGKAWVLTLATGAATEVAHQNVLGMRFSLDGGHLATYHSDRHVHLWDLSGGAGSYKDLPGMQGLLAAYSPADGGAIAMIERVNTMRLYKVSDGGKAGPSVSFKDAVIRADLTRDGKYVVAAIKDGTVWVWKVGSEGQPTQLPLGGSLYKLAFSPDGSLLATVEQSNVVRLWDVSKEFRPAGFIVNESQVQMREAAFSRDGKYIATAGTDRVVRVWALGDNDLGDACSRLMRNLTQAEFDRYLPGEPYRKTCASLP